VAGFEDELIPLTNKLQEAMNLTPLRAFLRALRNRSYVAPVVTSSGYPRNESETKDSSMLGSGASLRVAGRAQAGVAGRARPETC